MPPHSASFRSRVQLVVSRGLPSCCAGMERAWKCQSGSTEAPQVPQEQGSLRNLPDIQCALQHVISFGFRCALLWAPGWESCRPAGRGDITATSYPCLPCTAGFISLISIPAFSLLFSLKGRELCWRLVLSAVKEALSRSGRGAWVPTGRSQVDSLCSWV